jgi:hypothetical protein
MAKHHPNHLIVGYLDSSHFKEKDPSYYMEKAQKKIKNTKGNKIRQGLVVALPRKDVDFRVFSYAMVMILLSAIYFAVLVNMSRNAQLIFHSIYYYALLIFLLSWTFHHFKERVIFSLLSMFSVMVYLFYAGYAQWLPDWPRLAILSLFTPLIFISLGEIIIMLKSKHKP